MTQVCRQCSRINPPEASYCYHDGALLAGHSANGGPIHSGSAPFPSQFVFPNGRTCRNFDQLALTCQQDWATALDVLKQGFFTSFLGGLGRADLARAATEAAQAADLDRALDQLLAKFPTQVLQAPQLKVEPSEVTLGQLRVGEERQIELHLVNLGMRLLCGSVVSDCKWLRFGEGPGGSQKLYQFGAEDIIKVHVRGKHLRASKKPLEGRLVFDSNGGSATVIVRVDVPIIPFSEGVLAGSTSPRQIAEKAKAAPREAALLFENGAVARWFETNGWTYPVKGPSVGGVGGVQQFFEALGLAKPPKVELKTTSLILKGEVGQSVQTSIEVFTRDNKVLYAHATSDHAWLEISKVKLSGRNGIITLSIPRVPDRSGETLRAKVHIQGNGNQRFVVPVSLEIYGGNPFANLDAPSQPTPTIPVGKLVPEAPVMIKDSDVVTEPAAKATTPPPTPLIRPDPANPFSDFPPFIGHSAHVPPASPSATSKLLISEPVSLPARSSLPLWMHLLPLAVLALILMGLMIHDLSVQPVAGEEIDRRLALQFDKQAGTFGLIRLEPGRPADPTNNRLTFDERGKNNSTVTFIDGKLAIFGPAGRTPSGRWETPPSPLPPPKYGMMAVWQCLPEMVVISQTAEIVPGEPVEVTPGVFRPVFDTCLVRYRIENRDARPHKVGLRVLLDTYIGRNDGVPFTIPKVPGLVDKKYDMRDAEVPDFIQAQEFADLENPGVVAQLNLRLGGKLEPPSRVSLTRWPRASAGKDNKLEQHIWDEDIPVIDFENDSCVVLYWKEMELKAGASREVGYSYGLGNVTSKGKLGIVNPPPTTAGDMLTLVALIAEPKANQTTTLELPPGFTFADDSPATQKVPLPSANGQPSPVTWRIQSPHEPGTYTITVHTSDGLSHSRGITLRKLGIFQ